MRDRMAELLGVVLGAAPPRPRRKPQRYPHKARLYADEQAIANAHGFEVWRDFKPNPGCCPCGYNIYRAGTHPNDPNPLRPQHITVVDGVWPDGSPIVREDVHRSEVLDLLQMCADCQTPITEDRWIRAASEQEDD